MSEPYKTPDPHEQERNEMKDLLVSKLFPLIQEGKNTILKIFLTNNPRVATIYSNSRQTMLHVAVQSKNYEMMEFLLNLVPRRARVSSGDTFIDCRNLEGASALMEAVKAQDLKALRIILKHEPNFDIAEYESKEKAIHLAASTGNVAVMKEILNAKLKLGMPLGLEERTEKVGLAPLHLAVKEGKMDMVKYLVKLGADVNQQSTQAGKTPAMFAASNEQMEIYKYLASLPQTDLLIIDKYGRTISYYLDPQNLLEENKDNFDKVMDIISRNFNEKRANKRIEQFYKEEAGEDYDIIDMPTTVSKHKTAGKKNRSNQKIKE